MLIITAPTTVTKLLSLPAIGAVVALSLLAGCASPSHRAPVEERSVSVRPATPAAAGGAGATGTPGAPGTPTPSATAAAPATAPAAVPGLPGKPPPPGIENAGKPGYFTVRPGDTLMRIGLETGQNWRDIARWNNIDNPNLIEVGQVVRVAPPPAVATTQPVSPTGRVESRPLDARGAAGSVSAPGTAATPGTPGTPAPGATAAATREGDDELPWAWPAEGPVASAFDESKNKGLAIAGKAGDAVRAAADGRVVYSGSGLRGYGNLVIVKHNNTYLTAYAHNQLLLVKEDEVVRKGQKIAEMGSTDADRVQLHFEIRRQGKPVDPARLLPPR